MSATQNTVKMLLQGREIDPEALERFINSTIARRDVDSDTMHAAAFIVACRMGVQEGDNMKAELRQLSGFGRRKRNKGKFDFRPSEAALNSPAFVIVLQHVRDPSGFPIEKAIDGFTCYVAEEASTKTIKGWIETIRPRAEKYLATEDRLKAWLEKNR